MNLTYDGGDTKVQSLVDQLNAQVVGIGIPPSGAYPQRTVPFSPAMQMVSGGGILSQADSSGRLSGFFVPNDIPADIANFSTLNPGIFLYTGLTTTANPPTTTDLPLDGNWGWHRNSSDDSFYFAYNLSGTIRVPTGPPTAVIIQRETNLLNGGSAKGYQSGTPTGAAVTLYTRRITHMPTNYMDAVVDGSFVAANGGGGSPLTTGATWDLSPGVYLISFEGVYNLGDNSSGADPGIMGGLFNVTSSTFEVHSGTSLPVLFSPVVDRGNVSHNFTATFQAIVTVGTTSTYSIKHQCNDANCVLDFRFCGARYPATNDQINTVNPPQQFCTIRITKLA